MSDQPKDIETPETSPATEAEAEVASSRLQVPPWVQLVGLPMLVLFGYVFIKAASHAVVVFMIAGLISLLLAPVVRALVHSGIPRLLSVLMVFGMFTTLVTVLTIAAVQLVARQALAMRDNAASIGAAAADGVGNLQDFIEARGWDLDLRSQGLQFIAQLEERSTELSGQALEFGRDFVTMLAGAAFNLVLVVVITIYMLLDAPRISRMIASLLPARTGVETLFGRLERSLLRYTIGQTLASLVMGVSAAAGLWVIGKTGIWSAADEYAILFGIIVAVTEFAPTIGPVIGSVPPIITALFDGVGPAIAVALFFLLLHQIEGHIVIPKLMGAAIAVHPLLVIFGIIAGAQIMGIGGILLALPLLAVGREIVMFISERITLGRWPDPMPSTLFGTPGGAAPPGSQSVSETITDAITSDDRRGASEAAPGSVRARLRGVATRRAARREGRGR
ncbi:MAG: AI-2E family transporter [Gaiellales bacterium]